MAEALEALFLQLFGMTPHELLVEPMQYAFMERALWAVVLVGILSGVVGSFVVVRGMSFFGDALAHAVLPGVTIAYIQRQDLFIGGMIAGLLSALGIGWLTRDERLKEDTAIGIVFAGMFALGIAIISTTQTYSTDLTHILFGNVLAASEQDLRIMRICTVLVLGLVLLFYKELLALSFDPNLLRTLRLPAEFFRLLLLVLVAVVIVTSLQTVGVALMLAMLVAPAATAQLLFQRLHWMLLLAALLGAFSGVVGLYLSFHWEIISGAAIVLTSIVLFLLVFTLTQAWETLQNYLNRQTT